MLDEQTWLLCCVLSDLFLSSCAEESQPGAGDATAKAGQDAAVKPRNDAAATSGDVRCGPSAGGRVARDAAARGACPQPQ
jgi:hypothetical protein